MLSITKLIKEIGPDSYYTPQWRNLVENHLDYLRGHSDTARIELTGNKSYEYRGDFYGLLNYAGVPTHLHWAIMRVNGYTSPSDFSEDVTYFLIPAPEEFSKLNRFVANS